MTKAKSLTEEAWRRQALPFGPRIRQVQVRWKGHIDILKSLKGKATLLEDRKSMVFFKLSDAVNKLEGPPLIKDSTLLSPNELENELSKLRDKWVEEFNSLYDLSRDNMYTWILYYVNLNHNVSISISEARDDLLEIEKEASEMKIKQDLIVPPMWDYMFD